MTSKAIYGVSATPGSDGRYHYVYRITNLVENKHYYGSRTSKKNPYDDLGIKYFSSIINETYNWIIKDQKLNSSNYRYKIISCHETRSKAIDKEISLHRKFDVGINSNFYNGGKQTSSGFDRTGIKFDNKQQGLINAVNKDGEIIKVKLDDPRFSSGEIQAWSKNKVVVYDHNGNSVQVDKNDPLYKSGYYTHISKHRVWCHNPETLEERMVYKNELPDGWILGYVNKRSSGKVKVFDFSGKQLYVTVDDPRIKSGELKIFSSNKVSVFDKNGKSMSVDKNDPRLLSGELSPVSKGGKWYHNKSSGKSKVFLIFDEIPDGWTPGRK